MVNLTVVFLYLFCLKQCRPHHTGVFIGGLSRINVCRTDHGAEGHARRTSSRIEIVLNLFDPILRVLSSDKSLRVIELGVGILLACFYNHVLEAVSYESWG